MKRRYKFMLIILTLALSLGLATTAWAANPEADGGLLRGQVTAIDGDSLTVETRRGEVTLLTDGETVFEVPGVENATLADIAIGDLVVIRAVRAENGTPLARHVTVIPDGSLDDKVLQGVITALDGDTFQLRTREGEMTVHTYESTVFRIPDVENPTIADLREKMPVAVMGQYDDADNQVFHANAVSVIPGQILKRHVVRGELTAIEGTTLVVAIGPNGDEEQRVQTTEETIFRVPGVENPSIDDLNVGDRIVALGHRDENDNFVAKIVTVVPQRPRRVVVRGEVTSVGDSFLTLRTPNQDELTVLITDETLFRIPGDDDPGLEDIAVGDRVGVVGYRDENGNLVAKGVAKLPENVQQHIIRGEVTAIEGRSLRVSTGDGSVTVHTDENTRFRIPGVEDPGLDDIAEGDHIVAAGRWNEDGSLQALLVGKPRQRR